MHIKLSHPLACRVNKWLRNIYVLLALLHSAPKASYSQILGEDILQGKSEVVLPFQYIGGYILIDVYFHNIIPLKFILDTGASNTILFDRYYPEIFGENYSDTLHVVGSDIGSGIEGYIVRNGSFKIKDSKTLIRDYIVLSHDYVNLEERIGVKIDGILGSEFFKRLTLEIDYQRKKLRIHNPDKFKPHKKDVAINTQIINGKPYIPTSINIGAKEIPINLLLDTGASVSLIINSDSDSLITLPKGSIPGYLGSGLSGDIMGHIGLISLLNLGPIRMQNLFTRFQNISDSTSIDVVRNGLIGNVLLSKFNMTIDYIKGKVYLKPNKYFKKKIEVDKSGLVLHAIGHELRKYIVHYVYPDSPAAQAGLVKGDIITKVGRCKTKNHRLEEIIKKFRGKSGKRLKVQYLRGATLLKKELILRPLIIQ